MRKITLASVIMLMSATYANAADIIAPSPNQTEFQDQQRWRVIFSPYVWGASLNGNAGLFGLSTKVDVPFKEIFSNLDMSAMGNIEITNGKFGIYFDGQYTKTSQEEDVLHERLDLDIISTTLAGGVFYRAYEQELEGLTYFGKQRVFAIEPTVGIRWTQLKAQLNVGPFSETRKTQWTDPFVGTRILYDISDRWNLSAEADIGGFGAGTKLSANGQAYLGYRTKTFDLPTIWRVGYRVLYQDFNDNEGREKFKYDVTQHGPVIGVSIIF
ncbi:hypothetical protein ACFQ3K_14055 [Brucella gallinifaecis]|uniref:Outer membrane protein beta-barrel domain-containing protein n=1 Tax=Brucella gallinifaecis TaxID=215590 RepID=A0A502BTR5_9HYPH|nr:hypothetical protein [Brucella gallinifaecis]TPF76596.1 hypothetical protein FHY56_03630 [Brucella gallinifaecis]